MAPISKCCRERRLPGTSPPTSNMHCWIAFLKSKLVRTRWLATDLSVSQSVSQCRCHRLVEPTDHLTPGSRIVVATPTQAFPAPDLGDRKSDLTWLRRHSNWIVSRLMNSAFVACQTAFCPICLPLQSRLHRAKSVTWSREAVAPGF